MNTVPKTDATLETEWAQFVARFGVERVRKFNRSIPDEMNLESVGFLCRELKAKGFNILGTVDGLMYLRDHPI